MGKSAVDEAQALRLGSSSAQGMLAWVRDSSSVLTAVQSTETGLSSTEASRRLSEQGPNEIEETAPPSALRQLLRQFSDITVLALLAACALAFVLGLGESGDFLSRFGDAIAIGVIIVMNAAIGFVEERKAEHALRALRQLGAPTTNVIRDGEARELPARLLVVGDVVLLREGDRVPADARMLKSADFAASEAALTGESTPVEKFEARVLEAETPLAERSNSIFAGTHAVRGRGRAVVVATGMSTELGRIASMLGSVKPPETPLQIGLQRFGKLVVLGCAAISVVVFVVTWLRLGTGLAVAVLTAVSLAVAAIPEGLPAVTTIVLALGVQRMAKANALIRRLSAVETLGAANVVCTDKTGTLTQNRMVVRRVWMGGKIHDPEALDVQATSKGVRTLLEAARYAPGARVSTSGEVSGDPTDAALLQLHARLDGASGEGETRLGTLPFDRERKMATVLVAAESGEIASFTHGAPEMMLEHVDWMLDDGAEPVALDEGRRTALETTIEELAREGLRVIALATRTLDERARAGDRATWLELAERHMTLIGLVGIADPPRPEVKEAILRARGAGVSTVMITGDHPLTGAAIAREIGMLEEDGVVMTGPEIDRLSDAELSERVARIRVVARATAANKLRLIEAFRAQGQVVAMTGDGVNDAPAIKAADIGIAMGKSGTDVTREAADMVLLDDNYATIVRAIAEGRIVYSNIKRFIIFLFSANAALVIAVFVAAALGWPPILTPTQILWINLITNGLPALALGMEPVHIDPMREKPRASRVGFLTRTEIWLILRYGVLMAVLGLLAFRFGGDLVQARTAAFTVLALAPLFHAQSCRSEQDSIWRLGVFTNWRLGGAMVVAAGLQGVALYVPLVETVFQTTPLPAVELSILVGLSALVLVAAEVEKAARRAQSLRASRS